MLVLFGVILILIGLISAISLLISGYKELKKEEKKRSKVLFVFVALSEIFSPSSLSGFAFMLSLVAILIGIALIIIP
jgi:hypothetical protein